MLQLVPAKLSTNQYQLVPRWEREREERESEGERERERESVCVASVFACSMFVCRVALCEDVIFLSCDCSASVW